ncbi:MAG: hypothetical protein IT161_04245 [Bryobacterales bacterium]|nr:hypothetical protein [Bryobacterales bacterium]
MAQEHPHQSAADNYFLAPGMWATVRNGLAFLALAGWIASIAGFATNREQFHFSYLTAFLFCVSIGLGALFFVLVQHLSGSACSVTVRRLEESIMRTLPFGVVLFGLVVTGIHYTYHWSHESAKTDAVLKQKLAYLNADWFTIRGVIVFGLWTIWALVLFRKSRAQDVDGAIAHTRNLVKWSAPGLLLLFITASVASFDWIMSLDPHWFSTMFGVYFLTGGGLGFIAVLILICLALRNAGYLNNAINEEHYHDLGKWLFCMTAFWGYIAFSQYMLIWYGNLPEEIFWFKNRLVGSWEGMAIFLVFGHFLIPFFALLPRASKRNFKVLTFFAVWLLVMHYADIYWQVMPVLHKNGISPHWLDLATLVALVSTFGLIFWAQLRERPLVPVGDPRLRQSLAFHNA